MQPTTIRLYKFDEPSNQWQLEAADVRPNFFNENEDSAAAKAKWLVEMGNVEVEVTDQFNFEESGKRVIFQGNQGIWALRFPNDRGYQDFYRQYNDKLFENTYRLQNDDANRQKVSHSRYCPCLHHCSFEASHENNPRQKLPKSCTWNWERPTCPTLAQ